MLDGLCLMKKLFFSATADYFIFLIYIIENNIKGGRRIIKPHSITIPTKKLQDLTKEYKTNAKNRCNYHFWINPKTKKAFRIKGETKPNDWNLTKFLDKNGIEKLSSKII